MKKLLASLLLGAFLCGPAMASNTATNNGFIPVKVCRGRVEMVTVAIDTTGSDVTIKTPQSTNMVCLAGVFGSETNAANLTFKSGSTTLVAVELAANQGLASTMGNGILMCTAVGQALKIQSSAVYSSLLLNVVETENCDAGPSF